MTWLTAYIKHSPRVHKVAWRQLAGIKQLTKGDEALAIVDPSNADEWKWWYLQHLFDRAFEESNIADLTSLLIDQDELLTPVQLADDTCRRHLPDLDREGLIDGVMGKVSLTDRGREHVEARRLEESLPWRTKAKRWLRGWVKESHSNGAIAGGVVSAAFIVLTASDLPWWWKLTPWGEPSQPQQVVQTPAGSEPETDD